MSGRSPIFHLCNNSEQRQAHTVRLTPGVRLRCEHFGGSVFDTRSGLTLEVDRTAFTWQWTAREHGICPCGADAADELIPQHAGDEFPQARS